MSKQIKTGSLVRYIDDNKVEHAALVLEVLPQGRLLLRVFRTARPNLDVEAAPGRWRR